MAFLQSHLDGWIARHGEASCNFAAGGKGICLLDRLPGLNVVDLAGIAGAVETDDDAVDAGFGEGGKNQVLVVGAGVVGGRVGLAFRSCRSWLSPCVLV